MTEPPNSPNVNQTKNASQEIATKLPGSREDTDSDYSHLTPLHTAAPTQPSNSKLDKPSATNPVKLVGKKDSTSDESDSLEWSTASGKIPAPSWV